MDGNMAVFQRKIQCIVAEALALVSLDGRQRAREVEKRLWTLMLALGAALMELFFARQAAVALPDGYVRAGQAWQLSLEPATTSVGTLFGKVSFVRRVARLVGNARHARDYPIDRAVGLVGAFTPGVVLAMVRLSAQVAFGCARESFARTHGWTPAPRSVMRMVDAVGSEVGRFWEQQPAPSDDGDLICVEVDPKGAPMISPAELARRRQPHPTRHNSTTRRRRRRQGRRRHPRHRRRPGEKSKNARMCAMGFVYTLRTTPNGLEGPINKRSYSTFLGLEALFILLRREVDKRGKNKKLLFLADGQDAIWVLQRRFFPEAERAVDFWHVVERAWEAARLVHGEGSSEATTCAQELAWQIRHGQAWRAIAEIRDMRSKIPGKGPGNKWRRKRLLQIANYLDNLQDRMHYHGLRCKDLPIGSGIAEGGVRHVIGTRLDNSGMRWSLDRAEMVARLRCVLVNGEWDEFESYVDAHNLSLPAQPVPTRPHDAKLRDAA